MKLIQKEIKISWVIQKFQIDEKSVSEFVTNNYNKLILATYGILNPQVQWLEIPSPIEMANEIQHQFFCVNINKTNKKELLQQIKDYQPNILIFAGTFAQFEVSEMEEIGWDTSYAAKRYVNDDQLADTTAFYITSPTRLCIKACNLNDDRVSDKKYWYEMKKAVELWEEFR